ncbi:unnamed protein product [Natator depressus]
MCTPNTERCLSTKVLSAVMGAIVVTEVTATVGHGVTKGHTRMVAVYLQRRKMTYHHQKISHHWGYDPCWNGGWGGYRGHYDCYRPWGYYRPYSYGWGQNYDSCYSYPYRWGSGYGYGRCWPCFAEEQ